ncbi:GNAT family N-acetyltransferase [Bosea sp. 2KB_26]|uniref:GNAT family N-acetyltransferase n=1 Tax=Bosea sp. 2KB_26 TaxID=3237475 RepID=UPI000DE38FFC
MMTTIDQTIEIAALSERPHFREAVSDRIWKAWWRDEGYALEQIDDRVRQSLGPEAIPAALVAAVGEQFLGTVSLIDSDMDERPGYSPWVAALWVDPEHRRRGIGAALVQAAAARAFEAGFPTVYLCATPDNAPFYLPLGWRQIEANVAGLNILSLSR